MLFQGFSYILLNDWLKVISLFYRNTQTVLNTFKTFLGLNKSKSVHMISEYIFCVHVRVIWSVVLSFIHKKAQVTFILLKCYFIAKILLNVQKNNNKMTTIKYFKYY